MYRSLWPLPGGNQAYVTALEKLLPLASDQPTMSEFISRLQLEFPQVESLATANGYVRVLVALGFIELSNGQLSLTPAGREFIEEGDVALVCEALLARVVGVKELLVSLESGPRTMEELQQVLSELGLAWETNAQVGWRLHWLESVGPVLATEGRYELAAVEPSGIQGGPSTE
jgi:hypothetical protein